MNDLAVIENRAPTLTASQVKAQVQLIQQVMETVMKGPSKEHPHGVHYGVIPGTDKPTLLKAGCEVLMTTFRIAVEPKIDDLSSPDEIRYRVHCAGTHQTSGVLMGTGIGECSSNEEKYKWKRSNQREWDRTPEDRRRVKYGYDRIKREEYEVLQIRTEPADVANTILKMAKKRALVDFTLTALGASDCFQQDLEDIPEEIRDNGTEPEKKTVQQPKAKSTKKADQPAIDPAQKLTGGQIEMVQKKLTGANVAIEDFCKKFNVASVADLPFAAINKALDWIGEQNPE